jgi:uncharacterized protein YyaL (SSP411 family)
MFTNRLIDEKSPYLLQHAHNPVDWYPWGEAAFQKARTEDKPIFLSIGYSTCHWCHVMERESFESPELAAVLNRHFVPVKVDREERPDVDRIYMLFVQATTGGGGWPMSVWLTPDLKPFFGGTYFPPDNRYGRPGFQTILEYIANAWLSDRGKIVESGEQILGELKKHAEVRGTGTNWLDDSILESAYNVFRRGYDSRLGGFGGAPKFPRPVVHNFLFRYWKQTGNDEARDMVLHTLREMAKGGMNDQLGGGFHRYSVDERWFVPHFEKMLYDQAQLAVSYIEAHQITGDSQYASVARDIFDYVLRDMTHPEGGFYSAEDADSVIDPANPHEKGEGAFYVWSHAELEQLLGRDQASTFGRYFGVEPNGNVAQDPHQEFVGKNILYQAAPVPESDRLAIVAAKVKLLEARSRRIRPHLDDKILTAWNGLMISAFSLGAQVLTDTRYAQAARRSADFILSRMYDAPSGRLLRRFRDGQAAIPGFLDDYAFFANALVDLYETVFDVRYLEAAQKLAASMIELFEDRDAGAFYSTAEGDPSLVMRIKEDYDGAEPSGNSLAVLALLRLAAMTGRDDFRQCAERALAAFAPRLRTAPVGVPQMLVAYLYSRAKPRQVVIAGPQEDPETKALLQAVRASFLPERSLFLLDNDQTRAKLASLQPSLASMALVNGHPAAYVCENFACQLPVTTPDQVASLLA